MPPERALIFCVVSDPSQARPDDVSLNEQESACRDWCERQGMHVIEPPIVFAHSRNYIRFDKWARSMADKGIDAGVRLDALWESHGFDVLVTFVYDRLGRTHSLLSTIIEETIRMGGYIHVIQSGRIDKDNYHAFIGMAGFGAAQHNTRMLYMRESQMDKRAERGAPLGRYPTIAFEVLKGRNHREDRLIVRDDMRPAWQDLYRIVTAKLTADEMKRFSLSTPTVGALRLDGLMNGLGWRHPITGKPFSSGTMWRLLHQPISYGHNARFWSVRTRRHETYPAWVFDESVIPPPPVKVWRNTHEALWTADQIAEIGASLRHRHTLPGNHSVRGSVYPFSGLLTCAECGYTMIAQPSKYYTYWKCVTSVKYRLRAVECHNRGVVRDEWVKAFVTNLLAKLLASANPSALFTDQDDSAERERLATLSAEIARAEKQLDALIDQKVDAIGNAELLRRYTLRINEITAQLTDLRTNADSVSSRLRSPMVDAERNMALDRIRSIRIDEFWQLPSIQISQLLHAILQDWRIGCVDRKIVKLMKHVELR